MFQTKDINMWRPDFHWFTSALLENVLMFDFHNIARQAPYMEVINVMPT